MQTQLLIAFATLLFVGLLGYYIWRKNDGQTYMSPDQIREMTLQSAPKLCGDGLFFDGEKCVDKDGNLPYVCEACL